MNKKIIILLLFLAIIMSGCIQKPVKPNNEQPENNNVVQKNDEKKSTSTEEVDTSDWLTYRNEEYGIEFKYPNEIKLDNNEEKNEKGKLFKLVDGPGYFWFNVKNNQEQKSADDIKKDFYKNDPYGYDYEDSYIKISEIQSYKQGRYDLGVIENYYIPKNNNIFYFNFEFNFSLPNQDLAVQRKNLIKNILSTFKFIE